MFVYIDRIVRFITVMVYFILDNRFAYILLCFLKIIYYRQIDFCRYSNVYMKFFCVYFLCHLGDG